ncbi:condensation domain-containing protein [Streptomyces sp. NPDC087856]|uniref:condensation domain-containing protein n=1 Tax=Streptomyces sp. NPDC087856 TaxID=3365811 RepID=UPI0038162B08
MAERQHGPDRPPCTGARAARVPSASAGSPQDPHAAQDPPGPPDLPGPSTAADPAVRRPVRPYRVRREETEGIRPAAPARTPPDTMTAYLVPHAPTVVVLGPGPGLPARTAPWDLELRGPLDTAALERLLDRSAAGGGRHQLLRHGPDRHTLRCTAVGDTPAAAVAGRLADLLTTTARALHPLTPAQRALPAEAGTGDGDGWEAVYVDIAAGTDPDAVRRALHTVVTAHPHLRLRLDTAHGNLTGPAGPAGQDLLTEGEFTDEAGFTAAVTALGRTLDAPAGIHLRALLARDHRPTGPRTDRLALLAHPLITDPASWHTLLTDLTTALDTPAPDGTLPTAATPGPAAGLPPATAADPATAPEPVTPVGQEAVAPTAAAPSPAAGAPSAETAAGPAAASSSATAPDPAFDLSPAEIRDAAQVRYAGDALADWVSGLRELAADPAEARHWSLVAERRSRQAVSAAGSSRPGEGAGASAPSRTAPSPAPVPAAGAGPDAAGDSAPGDLPAATPDLVPKPPPAPRTPEAPDPVRHAVLTLDEERTERVVGRLARRLALTQEQVLTGVFALALARWQRVDEVGFDVRSDPRSAHPGLRGHVGRLTDVHPVQLTLEPASDALGQLAAAAGFLAAGTGRAAGGAGFGACREFSPDPLLRAALRGLPPASACLVLHGPDRTPPATAHPVPDLPHHRTHDLQAQAQITAGRLHLTLDLLPDTPPSTGTPALPDTPAPAGRTPRPAPGGFPRSPGTGGPAALSTAGLSTAGLSATVLASHLRDVLEELADAATAPIPAAFAPTAQQAALCAGGDARPGTGRHVEQLVWVWHGPLDTDRFGAAWQSVFDCEAVLRTAFTATQPPQLIVHGRVTPDITRRSAPAGGWSAFLEEDRLRGFDLRCPGALRLTLLERDPAPPPGAAPPARIVLTYHRALLDTWSAHLLLRTFYRAYLAGGTVPGGERRPDLRDYTAWIAAQDPGPARALWARWTPSGTAATRPGRPSGATGRSGVGRARLRLDPAETIRLARWAGTWGIAESGVLQAVWAMLIYRASGAGGPAPVSFAVTVPGRGIPLDGAAWLPGPLRNLLPVSLRIDPADTVPGLLRHLRDRALDMAAYEWLCDDRPAAPAAGLAETVLVFEDPPHPVHGLESDLAAQGIRAEFPGTLPARSVLPLALLAHHDTAGGLVLTGVHDRALLDEAAAAELLVQSALLLRELPLGADEFTTVAQVLKLLDGRAVPPMADPPPTNPTGPSADSTGPAADSTGPAGPTPGPACPVAASGPTVSLLGPTAPSAGSAAPAGLPPGPTRPAAATPGLAGPVAAASGPTAPAEPPPASTHPAAPTPGPAGPVAASGPPAPVPGPMAPSAGPAAPAGLPPGSTRPAATAPVQAGPVAAASGPTTPAEPPPASARPAAPTPAPAGPVAAVVASGPAAPLTLLRAARHDRAGTVCLVAPPGASPACYDLLPPAYPGPQELLLLTTPLTDTASDVGAAGPASAVDAAVAALAVRSAGRPLLLAGFSGAGAVACALAGRLGGEGRRPPRVVLVPAPPGERERVRILSRALQDATAPPP